MHFEKVNFEVYHTALPRQYNNVKLILRCIWTSFDYLSDPEANKDFEHIAVGGIVNCRMFGYPEDPVNRRGQKMRTIKSINDSLKLIPYPDPTLATQTEGIETIYKLQDYVYTTDKDDI